MAKFEGLQLVWLESFVNVAESGKRTAAAHEMGISQGTVTKHIQKLEQWLGGSGLQPVKRLLVDDGVPARLYPDGEKFLPVAKQILELLDQARRPAVFIETTHTPSKPRVSPKDFKVPPLRQPQNKG